MTQKLRVLGLALVAVLAMSAIASANAFAFKGESLNTSNGLHESGTIKGSGINTQSFKITSGSLVTLTCSGVTTSEASTGSEETPQAEPHYTGCSAAGFPAEVKPNGCKYKFHTTTETVAGMNYTGTTDVVCGAGAGPFVYKIFESNGTTLRCEVEVKPQTGINNIEYVNTTNTTEPTDVDIKASSNNVKTKVLFGSFFACGASGENSTGTYSGETTVRFFNGAGTQIDYTIM